jgi:hypothetical protein
MKVKVVANPHLTFGKPPYESLFLISLFGWGREGFEARAPSTL